MSFGKILSDARKDAGLSQKELAAIVRKEDGQPISPQYLNDLERDRRNPPSDFLIEQFAKALQVPSDLLYHHAGSLPADLKGTQADPDAVVAAYSAFRKAIKGD